MRDVDAALTAARAAVNDLLTAADKCQGVWTVPRAPGKWSPSQVVEHVALVLDESANAICGAPTKLPKFPGFVRPLVRILFFNRALKKGTIAKTKAGKAFDPVIGSATPAAARIRLATAFDRFDQACRQTSAKGEEVKIPMFGAVSVADYARFQELHTRHHSEQIPRI